jgi:glycosyltransferase involved in cell wall biosynthesis
MLVSAIVPTWNRAAALGRTLESLAVVEGEEIEIVVVDNASTDATAAVCAEVRARHPARRWRYVQEPMPGLLSGRHRGANEATGEICAYLDDDVQVAPGWLAAIQEGFRRPEVALVGGPSTPGFAETPPAWLEDFWTSDAQGRHCTWLSLFDGGDRIRPVDPRYVWGLNYAIRRTALFSLGGFHPDCLPRPLQRFQGDGETGLSDKLAGTAWSAIYHPGMAVQHEVPGARLTAHYFEDRAFYQGVCDSYTSIRAHGAVGATTRSWRDRFRGIKRHLRSAAGGEAARIRRQADRAYEAGFQFHQKEVKADARLRDWVLRPDYLDYRLPEGWQDFLRGPGPAR